jgi:hypothetical protein
LAPPFRCAGCATQGDFGEVRPSLVRDDIHDWLSLDTIAGWPTLPSSFELTDDERQIRDLSYPLIEPSYYRQQWYSAAGEYGVIGSDHRTGFDCSAYTNRLMSFRYRSPAARVLDIDQKRRKSLAYIFGLSQSEQVSALRRIRENALLVSLVRAKLAQRVTGYRFALERLVVMIPSPQAVEVERSLNQIKDQLARYHNRSAPTWVREQSLVAAR